MPIYQYECGCGRTLELMHCMGRTKPVICPSCHKYMKKVISPVRGIVKNPAVPRKVK